MALAISGRSLTSRDRTARPARYRRSASSAAGEGGAAPGFIALQDDASSAAFAKARSRGRILHSAKGVNRTIDIAISARLAGKDQDKYVGHILLITAPIGSSPNRSAEDLQATLGIDAQALPFAEVHVMDATRGSSIVQLK